MSSHRCILTVGSRALAVTLIGLDASLSCVRLNCFPISITLSVSVKITLGGSAAGWLSSAQQSLQPWLLLAVWLPAHYVCLCVYTSAAVESVYIQILHLLFVPFKVCARVCASILFPALAVPSKWWPGSPLHMNLLHARCWLTARSPYLSSVRSPHFLSLPVHRKAILMWGWLSKGLFIAAHHCSLAHFRHSSFFRSIWSVQASCNWFVACKTAQLIEIALFYSSRRYRMYSILHFLAMVFLHLDLWGKRTEELQLWNEINSNLQAPKYDYFETDCFSPADWFLWIP